VADQTPDEPAFQGVYTGHMVKTQGASVRNRPTQYELGLNPNV
jgi:hypothetical protein